MSSDSSPIDPDVFESLVDAVRDLHARVGELEDQMSSLEQPVPAEGGSLGDEIASIGTSLETMLASLDDDQVPGDIAVSESSHDLPVTDPPEGVDLREAPRTRRSKPAGWQPVPTRRLP